MSSLWWLTGTVLAGWQAVTTQGPTPSPRGGGQMQQVGPRLVLFGGLKDCFDSTQCANEFYNDVFHLELATRTWVQPTVVEDPVFGRPEPRAFFGSTVDHKNKALIVYGGTSYPVDFVDFTQWNEQTRTFGDLWFYYPEQARFERRVFSELQAPGPRSGVGLAVSGQDLYLCSGINSNSFLSVEDLWRVDLQTSPLTWTQITGSFSQYTPNPFGFPLGRYIFPFVKTGGRFLAFSGNILPIPPLLGEQYQDLWSYSVGTNTWSQLSWSVTSPPLTGRVHGGLAVVEDTVVVFFGDNNDNAHECVSASVSSGQSPVNETWLLPLQGSGPLVPSLWDNEGADGQRLKRIYYTNSVTEEQIFVFGGFDVACQDSVVTLAWNSRLYSLAWSEVTQT